MFEDSDDPYEAISVANTDSSIGRMETSSRGEMIDENGMSERVGSWMKICRFAQTL
jgi:hypothetical protein